MKEVGCLVTIMDLDCWDETFEANGHTWKFCRDMEMDTPNLAVKRDGRIYMHIVEVFTEEEENKAERLPDKIQEELKSYSSQVSLVHSLSE